MMRPVVSTTDQRVSEQASTSTSGAIDAVANFPFATDGSGRPTWAKAFTREKLSVDPRMLEPFTVDAFVGLMDEFDVAHALLIATKAGSRSQEISFRVSLQDVAEVTGQRPDRFSGLVGIDPTEGMSGVRELSHAVEDLGFVGAHLYPHWFELPPDHRRYYPFYAKCEELGVPVQIQVGHCLRYSERRPLPSVGRPLCLDTLACDFPSLSIIGIHTGWPWTEEMISVAYKHPNVFIATDAYAPRHWPKSLRHFADSWGRTKVLFGTDFPVLTYRRAMSEIREMALRPESEACLLRENALTTYKLADRLGRSS